MRSPSCAILIPSPVAFLTERMGESSEYLLTADRDSASR